MANPVFGANLKLLRTRRGRSQEETAIALDVKRSSYSGYENGSAEPSFELLVRMSEYFKVSIDKLLKTAANAALVLEHGHTLVAAEARALAYAPVLAEALGGAPDLVLSDMAANTTGHKATDHLRTMGLVECAAHFAIEHLAPGGAFVAKVLAGGTDTALLALLKAHFTTVKHAKPPASRKDSSEWYVIAQGFKARAGESD